jgi:hypothetical protein
MSETWLPIPGYEGYEVSSQGRVRSLSRPIRMRSGRTQWCDGQILSPIADPRTAT